jgi:outer membrane protein assembly factor BamB
MNNVQKTINRSIRWFQSSSFLSIKFKHLPVSVTASFIVIFILTSTFSVLYVIPSVQSTLQTTTIDNSKLTSKLLWNYTANKPIFFFFSVVDGVIYVNTFEYSDAMAINATTGTKIWFHSSGTFYNTAASLAVVNGRVYQNSQGKFWTLNATDGTELWNYKIGGGSSPVVVDGVVYVGSEISNKGLQCSSVVALDAVKGTKLWHVLMGNQSFNCVVSSPAVVDGVVYIGAEDNNVYALNAKNGKTIWSFLTGDSVYSSPVVVDGVVYIGSGDRNVYALDAKTGEKLWSYETGGGVGEFGASPVVVDGVVYVGSRDHNIYALDASNGEKLWSYTTGEVVHATPAVANGVVYVSSFDNNFYCLNAKTGEKLWSTSAKYSFDSPTIVDGVVYVPCSSDLYAFSAIMISPDSPTPLPSASPYIPPTNPSNSFPVIIIGVISGSIVGAVVIIYCLKIKNKQ